eukprot:TRINITY_DN74682_c0_g1_i1.p1 TRINITY_DN74682_c0_g1~~TRINITY_DN74682_c0_g1_i1.p1  ORF type:complete len:313 (-),score=64.46 TRINITY_DN74682_c0_g1_i1:26-964(-)
MTWAGCARWVIALMCCKCLHTIRVDDPPEEEKCMGMEAIPENVSAIFINMKSRPDRSKKFVDMMKPFFDLMGDCKGWTLQRIDGVQINLPSSILQQLDATKEGRKRHKKAAQRAAALSHLNALKAIDDANYSLIFEDDYFFAVSPQELANRLNSVLKHLDNNWDVLMLGDNSYRQLTATPDLEGVGLMQTKAAWCSEAYLVGSEFRKKLVDTVERLMQAGYQEPFDTLWTRLQARDESKWYVFRPRVGKQEPGFSDIEGKPVDYNLLELNTRARGPPPFLQSLDDHSMPFGLTPPLNLSVGSVDGKSPSPRL